MHIDGHYKKCFYCTVRSTELISFFKANDVKLKITNFRVKVETLESELFKTLELLQNGFKEVFDQFISRLYGIVDSIINTKETAIQKINETIQKWLQPDWNQVWTLLSTWCE